MFLPPTITQPPDTLHNKSSNFQPFNTNPTKMADTWNIVSAAVNKLLCVLGDPEACGGVDTPAFAESLQLPRDTIIAYLSSLRFDVQSWPLRPLPAPIEGDDDSRTQAAIVEIHSIVVNGDARQIVLDVIEGVEADIIEDFGDDFDDNDENDY